MATTAKAKIKPNAGMEAAIKEGSAKSKTSTILDVWGKSDDAKKSDNLQRKFKILMAEGNKDLIQKEIAIDEAQTALEKAQNGALQSADFNAIATANLRLRAAKLEFEDALSVFSSTFGVEPNI